MHEITRVQLSMPCRADRGACLSRSSCRRCHCIDPGPSNISLGVRDHIDRVYKYVNIAGVVVERNVSCTAVARRTTCKAKRRTLKRSRTLERVMPHTLSTGGEHAQRTASHRAEMAGLSVPMLEAGRTNVCIPVSARRRNVAPARIEQTNLTGDGSRSHNSVHDDQLDHLPR